MSHLRKLFKGKTVSEIREGSARVVELIKDKKIPSDTLSIRDIAESTLGDDGMDALAHAGEDGSFVAVQEAVDPVNLTAFSNITGMLILQGVMEQYRRPELIGDQLVTQETSREDNTRIPGLQPISDDALVVDEGTEYPDTKFGEDYIDVPKSKKRGRKIGVTREMVFFDKTGLVMEMARGVGERMGTNREKRILQTVLGITNTFTRNGTARNTYVAVATDTKRPNLLASAELLDWNQLDVGYQMFAAMVDDNTVAGEPIEVTPDTLLVTPYKLATASIVLGATENRILTNSSINTTIGVNPLSIRPKLNILTSPWIQWLLVQGGISAANAKDYWYMGQFKKGFVYRTIFPLQVRAAKHDKDDFERDVVMQFRADERGVCYTKAPWYAINFYKG